MSLYNRKLYKKKNDILKASQLDYNATKKLFYCFLIGTRFLLEKLFTYGEQNTYITEKPINSSLAVVRN